MAKVGYIFLAEAYDSIQTDKAWMEDYGCVRIIEEKTEDEKLRPEWKTLLMSLERGDELVISKFSNALRGSRELSFFLELCRIKVIRVISINDRLDSKDQVFPALKTSDFLDIIGSLPAEVATQGIVARHATAHGEDKDQGNQVTSRARDNHCQHVQRRPCHRRHLGGERFQKPQFHFQNTAQVWHCTEPRPTL